MDSEWHLALAVITMNDADYLKTIPRMTTEEREAWNTEYGLSSLLQQQKPYNADDLYEAHSHHGESHYGAH